MKRVSLQMMKEIIVPPDSDPTCSISKTDTVNVSHKFVIKGYSLLKGRGIRNYIASDTFTARGYQWAIFFYPDGKNREEDTYVSVFIALVGEGRNVRALFNLTLVDQSGKGKHKVHNHFDRSLESGPYTLKCQGCMWGYNRFFRRDALETSDNIKDDCLEINCTVGVVVSSMDYSRLYSIQVPESDMGIHFGMLLEKQESSDVIFYVDGENFHAHKLILAARSPIFRTMFFDGADQISSEITVTDLEPKVFKTMMHFIYKDTLDEDDVLVGSRSPGIPVSDTLIAKLLAKAEKYDLGRMRLMCESYLCKDISVNTVTSILVLADRFHAIELKATCLRFATENLSAVMRTSGFEYLKENYPSLQSELLKVISGEEECSSGGKGRSVCDQLSDGDDSNGRRVRQRIE